jgi:hypothetical protein
MAGNLTTNIFIQCRKPGSGAFYCFTEQSITPNLYTYESFGVGLPFLPEEGKLHHVNGKYLLSDLKRKFDIINIGFMDLAQQELSYHGQEYSFRITFYPGPN